MAVFISSHILSEVQHLCNRVAFINDGTIKAVENVINKSIETDTYIICLKIKEDINIDKLKSIDYINSVKVTED